MLLAFSSLIITDSLPGMIPPLMVSLEPSSQKIVTFSVFMLLPKRSRFAGLLYVTFVRPRNLNENVLLTVKNSLASAGLKDSTGFPPPMEVKGFAPQVIMSHISMNSAVEPLRRETKPRPQLFLSGKAEDARNDEFSRMLLP